jgi:IclR family mhp operon transcriptional activator
MGTYKKVESLARGFSILEAVSANPGASNAQISELVGLHRATVYRMLETLETLGYVRRRIADDAYFVTHAARALSNLSADSSELLDAVTPCLRDLNSLIEWPSSVVVPAQQNMIIRETTHGRSKISVHNVGVGTPVPMFTSAAGRAYLSYCSDDNRRSILNRMGEVKAPLVRRSIDKKYIDNVIEKTRRNGYAIAMGEAKERLGCIALPLHQGNDVVASINIVFLTVCIDEKTAVSRYLPPLQETVDRIEARLNH